MENHSDVKGTITLKGDWREEEIAVFQQMLDLLECLYDRESGGLSCWGKLSINMQTIKFEGSGAWDISKMLKEFGENLEYNLDNFPEHFGKTFTMQIYKEFLGIMKEKNLSIIFDFAGDDHKSCGAVHENGVLTSDGTSLNYQSQYIH